MPGSLAEFDGRHHLLLRQFFTILRMAFVLLCLCKTKLDDCRLARLHEQWHYEKDEESTHRPKSLG